MVRETLIRCNGLSCRHRKGTCTATSEAYQASILEKQHAHREPTTTNQLTVEIKCPYNEAIIDENRIETALRNAFGVPDLTVTAVEFRIK